MLLEKLNTIQILPIWYYFAITDMVLLHRKIIFLRAPCSWKMLKIGSVIVNIFKENILFSQIDFPAPAPPTPLTSIAVYVNSKLFLICINYLRRLYVLKTLGSALLLRKKKSILTFTMQDYRCFWWYNCRSSRKKLTELQSATTQNI